MSEKTAAIKKAISYLNEQYARTVEIGDELDAIGGDVCVIVSNEIYRLHDRIQKAVTFIEKLSEALAAYEGSA